MISKINRTKLFVTQKIGIIITLHYPQLIDFNTIRI